MHDVLITGIGIVSCLGTGVGKVADGLQRGRSGIVRDPERERLGFRSALTGRIDDFSPDGIERKARRTMTEFGQHAYVAAREALVRAGWTEEETRSTRTGLIVGNDSATLANVRQTEIVREQESTFPIGASTIFQALNSTVTMNLNVLLKNRGAAWTISGACASGSHAIGQAADLIALGRQDRAVCGGAQEINWESVSSFDSTNAFSTYDGDSAGASRPFDAGRDGLVPSGGAAMVCLERGDLARARGADALGCVRAYAFSSDGRSLASPSGEGLARCAAEALERAKVAAGEVDYVCAHATSTPIGDRKEAEAIAAVFGEADGGDGAPWVSSTKSMTGHEMWMAGAAQVVYVTLMGRGGFIAPSINFTRQEAEAPALRIAAETLDGGPRIALLNSAGFGGTNASLVLELFAP